MRGIIAALGVGLVTALACGPEVEPTEELYEPDLERLCNAFCDEEVRCGILEMTVYEDWDGCYDWCVSDELWEHRCNREYEGRIECVSSLTCAERVDESLDSELPREERPCYQQKVAWQKCHDST